MKRLLLPLLTALALPTAVNAEKTFKCLELGEERCLNKLVAIGACGMAVLENSDEEFGSSLDKSYKFYDSLKTALRIKNANDYLFPVKASNQKDQMVFAEEHCADQWDKLALKRHAKNILKLKKERTKLTKEEFRESLPLANITLFRNYIYLTEVENK
tara:strand:- start:34 stop:507 length:474 start_codon:yes stop_codon:yes gene_type:complete